MLKMLVDTCVWLDMAKTPSQSIEILSTLRAEEEVDIIVPRIVLDEFLRNRDRVIGEYVKSLTTTLSRAKEIVVRQGGKKRIKALDELFDQANSQIRTPKHVAEAAANQIEALLQAGDIVETTDTMKLRASERAIQHKAPFHRDKNSINDALLIEAYADFLKENDKPGRRFAFVTHNHRDFSEPTGNQKLPHPDFSGLFSARKSRYYINIGDVLSTMHLKGASAWMFETYDQPIRSMSDILDAIDELVTKVWVRPAYGVPLQDRARRRKGRPEASGRTVAETKEFKSG
jgi:PIN domain